MPNVVWRLDGRLANLCCGPLVAGVDLFTPSQGLIEPCWRQQPLTGWQLLGVDVEALDAQPAAGNSAPTAGTLGDRYQRGGDLVATYEPSPRRPFRVQVYWRATLVSLDGHELPTVDLQVSVQTNLLDSRPELTAISLLPNCVTIPAVSPSPGETASQCRLFRRPDTDVTYAQQVHPADFHAAELTSVPDGGQHLHATLFGGALEKGVILRARVRGVFVPRQDDEALAAAVFAEFARQPPPLTT